MAEQRRVVVKVGSSTLTGADGRVDRDYLRALVAQVVAVRATGARIVLVTSGAIAAGIEELELSGRPQQMPALQAVASVGQTALIGTYADLFAEHGVHVGQVLISRHDTSHRQQYLHARDTFQRLLEMGVVPVVNENDTTAVEEIRFGDNDTLAALVAVMVRADLVVMLSDTEGLYDADPRVAEGAVLLESVEELTDDVVAAAGGPGSALGSGGMATKVEAARVLRKAGIPMVLCDGRRPDAVSDAVAGKPVGTRFSGGEGSVSQRKLWIAFAQRPAGVVFIDDGARDALRLRGKSLLPAGVVDVSGDFGAGDAVVLKDREGTTVGRGLAGMSAAVLRQVKGLRTAEIGEVLPGYGGEEVVHRDCLVIL